MKSGMLSPAATKPVQTRDPSTETYRGQSVPSATRPTRLIVIFAHRRLEPPPAVSAIRPRLRFALPIVLAPVCALVACAPEATEPEPPDLLVLVVVDQLRADLLEAHADLLDGGLGRMLRRGARFTPTRAGHAVTNSSPGHATLATGSYPSAHGIVDNGLWLRTGDGWRYGPGVLDTTASLVGDPEAPAFSSAQRLVPAIGDWARAADPSAISVSIGQGAHSANAMAAHQGGHSYWFSADHGGYVTSDRYVAALPDWVRTFNDDALRTMMAEGTWRSTVPPGVQDRAVSDDNAWEARGGRAVFPHDFADETPEADRSDPAALPAWFETTPGIDRSALGLARSAVGALQLGTRGPVDVLTINLSSLDEAGHRFGPWSQEQLDALLRLDDELGAFMDFLDRSVGPDAWAMAVSADHGVATPPMQRVADGDSTAVLVSPDSVAAAYERIAAALPADGTVEDRFAIARDHLEAQPWVARVYSVVELGGDGAQGPTNGAPVATSDDPYLEAYRRSFHSDRRVDFPVYDRTRRTAPMDLGIGAVRMTENAMMDYATAIHGSPYDHDVLVPFLLLGPGVLAGARGPAVTVDVAPTLAGLASLPVPPTVDGRDLLGS